MLAHISVVKKYEIDTMPNVVNVNFKLELFHVEKLSRLKSAHAPPPPPLAELQPVWLSRTLGWSEIGSLCKFSR